jgi:hypothetical protein
MSTATTETPNGTATELITISILKAKINELQERLDSTDTDDMPEIEVKELIAQKRA